MSTNLLLILCSLAALTATYFFGKKRWKELDIVDLCVMMITVFFGAYTLVDAIVNDLSQFDPWLAIWTHLLVFLMTGACWLSSRLLGRELITSLRLTEMATQWSRINTSALWGAFFAVCGIIAFGYHQFGILSQVDSAQLENAGVVLPYWFTSIKSVNEILIFCVFIGVSARLLASPFTLRAPELYQLIAIAGIASLYGRRNLFILGLILVILWCQKQGKSLFSSRNLLSLSMFLAAMFLFSNIYQSYRVFILNPSRLAVETPPNLIEAVLDSSSTISNLELRMPMWQFNYIILDRQSTASAPDIPFGGILLQGLQNAMPAAILENKEVYNLDEMVADTYRIPTTDYPSNNFASTQADFGYLSLAIMPTLFLINALFFAIILSRFSQKPFLYLLLSGMIIKYLLGIEQNYGDIFIIYRNIAILLILSIIFTIPIKIMTGVRPIKT